MKTKDKILWPLALAGLVVTIFLFNRGAAERAASGPAQATVENDGGAVRTNFAATNASTTTPTNTLAPNDHSYTAGSLAILLAAIEGERNPGLQTAALVKLVDGLRLVDAPAALTASAGQTNRMAS